MSRAETGLCGVEEAPAREPRLICDSSAAPRPARRLAVTFATALAIGSAAALGAAPDDPPPPPADPQMRILGVPVDLGLLGIEIPAVSLEHEPASGRVIGDEAFGQNEVPLLMIQPQGGRAEEGTAPTVMGARVEPRAATHPYIRVGALIRFPEDIPIDSPFVGDQTLGWGGGLNVALGMDFASDMFAGDRTEGLRPRLELEYQLLLADYRGQIDVGYTQNSLGLNTIVAWEVTPGFRPYAGLGGGGSYVTFSRAGPDVGGDEFTWYAQIMGGLLFRFDRYTEIDVGIRYKHTEIGIDGIDTDLGVVILNVGLVFHMH